MHFSNWRTFALLDGNHIAHISSAAGSPAVDRWLLDGHGVSRSLFKVIGMMFWYMWLSLFKQNTYTKCLHMFQMRKKTTIPSMFVERSPVLMECRVFNRCVHVQ